MPWAVKNVRYPRGEKLKQGDYISEEHSEYGIITHPQRSMARHFPDAAAALAFIDNRLNSQCWAAIELGRISNYDNSSVHLPPQVARTMALAAERRGRYSRVVEWARRRYTDACGRLLINVGGKPSKYAQIERAAWRRYMQ